MCQCLPLPVRTFPLPLPSPRGFLRRHHPFPLSSTWVSPRASLQQLHFCYYFSSPSSVSLLPRWRPVLPVPVQLRSPLLPPAGAQIPWPVSPSSSQPLLLLINTCSQLLPVFLGCQHGRSVFLVPYTLRKQPSPLSLFPSRLLALGFSRCLLSVC